MKCGACPPVSTLMYVAGLVSALLGIGSGILKIPAMDNALRLPIKVSTATSNFMIGVTAAASASAYFLRGEIVSAIAGPVALGSVIGAIAGRARADESAQRTPAPAVSVDAAARRVSDAHARLRHRSAGARR